MGGGVKSCLLVGVLNPCWGYTIGGPSREAFAFSTLTPEISQSASRRKTILQRPAAGANNHSATMPLATASTIYGRRATGPPPTEGHAHPARSAPSPYTGTTRGVAPPCGASRGVATSRSLCSEPCAELRSPPRSGAKWPCATHRARAHSYAGASPSARPPPRASPARRAC